MAVDISAITFDDPDEHYLTEERILRRRIVLGVLIITALLWLTNHLHGIPVAAVSGIPIILLTMLGIIHAEDVRKLPWDLLMLVTGGLSLGLAVSETGLATHYVEKLEYLSLNLVLLTVLFALVTIAMSNIMSNTATATILIPLGGLLSPTDPLVLPVVIGLSASCALFLPVSTPPNAIAFSTGYLRQSDFRLGGMVVGFGGSVVILCWVFLVRSLAG